MGSDTENNSWTWKVATDTVSSIQGAAHYRGACLIDARFTFQPGGTVLMARGLNVGELTNDQLDMIVEWRVSDTQPSKADAMIQHLKERRKPMGISSIEASKYPHYFKDVRHLNYVDIYRILDLFEITDQPVAHAIKKLMAAGKRGAKDADKDISEAIDCLLRRKTMNREDSRKSNNLT